MAEISVERFEFALNRLQSSDWARFEKIASIFLASDWSQLRTMASPSGDGGRDSELYAPNDDPTVAIQYSVRKDWAEKIKETIDRLKKTSPTVTSLIFLTNQLVGASADRVKKSARERGIFLDVRDQTWFVERVNLDQNRANAAIELARVIVDPILETKNVVRRFGDALSQQEAKTALVFLEMQLTDERRGKGLTKSSFEALVRGVLRGTDNDNRLKRSEIHERIGSLLPKHSAVQLSPYVDAALNRLTKSAIRHWQVADEFCMSHQENERMNDVVAEIQLLNDEFDQDALDIASSIGKVRSETEEQFLDAVRTIIGRYFLKMGEEFASAIARETDITFDVTNVKDIVIAAAPRTVLIAGQNNVDVLLRVVSSLFADASDATREYLRILSDSYTLFAFLEETPDVQKATRKMFNQADIWLDTSVLLPIFAEVALPETMRPFTTAFKQARSASINIFLTQGVLEEIERHLNLCVVYSRSNSWKGRAPYVIAQYLLSGRKPDAFSGWMEQFCGHHNPDQDIADYLSEEFGIVLRQQGDDAVLDKDVVFAVEEYWRDIQERRRNTGENFNLNANRLAAHDSENYLLVLRQRKKDSGKSPLGFTSWWLTMDHAAWKMREKLEPDVWAKIRHSPLMSIDFLLKYLAFGPNRDRVEASDLAHAQVFGSILVEIPTELLDAAQKVRSECGDLPERIVQRRIRDAWDAERAKIGPVQDAGLEGATKAIGELF